MNDEHSVVSVVKNSVSPFLPVLPVKNPFKTTPT
jgi:hypothetical protein